MKAQKLRKRILLAQVAAMPPRAELRFRAPPLRR